MLQQTAELFSRLWKKTNKQKNQNTFLWRTRNSQVSEEKATHQEGKQLYKGEENKDIYSEIWPKKLK